MAESVKLVASWDLKRCDGCGRLNDTDDEFPRGWCVLVVSAERLELCSCVRMSESRGA